MKHILLIIFSIFIFVAASANDTIMLSNNKVYIGKVSKISRCQVLFKANKTSYHIPAKDIYSIKFADSTDKVYIDYIRRADSGKCLKGKYDAEQYHDGNIYILEGILLGPIAFIIAAVDEPKPSYNVIINTGNKDLINDYEYLACYSAAAKTKNMTKAAIGCGVAGIADLLFYIIVFDALSSATFDPFSQSWCW